MESLGSNSNFIEKQGEISIVLFVVHVLRWRKKKVDYVNTS